MKGSSLSFPSPMKFTTWEAAARASMTESWMSLQPVATPAAKMPSLRVEMGSSFTCLLAMNRSSPRAMPSLDASSPVPPEGTIAEERTARSTWFLNIRPVSMSSTRTSTDPSGIGVSSPGLPWMNWIPFSLASL